jgi:hypothetical protein
MKKVGLLIVMFSLLLAFNAYAGWIVDEWGRTVWVPDEPEVGCTSAPRLDNVTITPDTVQAPNNKKVVFTVTGKVTAPIDCRQNAVSYSVVDEYGDDQGGSATVTGENLKAEIKLRASRDGDDKDGRLYTITVSSSNEAGPGDSEIKYVRIGHDKRN